MADLSEAIQNNDIVALQSQLNILQKASQEDILPQEAGHQWAEGLYLAVHQGHTECVKVIINHHVNWLTLCDLHDGCDLLVITAAVNGYEDVVKVLVESGASISRAFYTLFKNNEVWADDLDRFEQCVRLMLACGARVDTDIIEELPILVIACHMNRPPLVNILLQAGATPNRASKFGNTPLIASSSQGNEEIVRSLLKHAVDVDAVNKIGKTALMCAVTEGHLSVVETLLNEGCADVNILTAKKSSALMFVPHDNVEMTRLLCERGCDVNHRNNFGQTSLVRLLNTREEVSVGSVECLLQYGSDVNIADDEGNTPLMLAACTQSTDVIKSLLVAGAKVNLRNSEGNSAVMLAVEYSKDDTVLSVCQCLLENGAFVKEEVHAAIIKGRSSVAEAMLSSGAFPRLEHLKFNLTLSKPLLMPLEFEVSPLVASFLTDNLALANLFINVNFLHKCDINLPDGVRSAVISTASTVTAKHSSCRELCQTLYGNPWSLFTMCFVTVSTCVGFDADRQQKLLTLGLPTSIQNSLMFKTKSNKHNAELQRADPGTKVIV